MTSDSIPQQAGPGAGADELHAAIRSRVFRAMHDYRITNGDSLYRDFMEVAALAVEDSRERDSELLLRARDALERVTTSETFHRDPRGDTAGPVIDAIDAAMAAASSGKEN